MSETVDRATSGRVRRVASTLFAALAMWLPGSVAAQPAPPVAAMPEPGPPLSAPALPSPPLRRPPPELSRQIGEILEQLLDDVRLGYTGCMKKALRAHALAHAPGGDVSAFQLPATMAERDALADAIIARCAEPRATFMSEIDATVANQAPFGKPVQQFAELIRAEFEAIDEELRANLRNFEPGPAPAAQTTGDPEC